MESAIVIIALGLLLVAAVSRRLEGSPLTAAMIFVALGVIAGPHFIDGIDFEATSGPVRSLAEATLTLVLFSDASRIDLGRLRREAGVPARLLGFGLPLTIVLGAIVAGLIFDQLSVGEAAVLGVILAPTDAALGQAVVTARTVPARIRQGLNIESGLNDGICVPLLFIAVAAADIESDINGGRTVLTLLSEEIGFGILAGALAGALIAAIIIKAGRRDAISGAWKQVIPAAGAALAYSVAAALGGSGFIAAFVAGIAFRMVLGRDPDELNELTEEVGGVLSGVTLMIFGAILLGPSLEDLTWQLGLFAILSLTVVRMLPVAIAMVGSRARWPTLGFLGWFGPRGLASIVFAVIVLEESNLPHQGLLLQAIFLTVGLSVFAHGLTAAPLARRYGRWFKAHPRDKGPALESGPSVVTRLRHGMAGAVPPDSRQDGKP